MRSRAAPYAISLLTALVVLGGGWVLDLVLRERLHQSNRSRVLTHLSTTRARLEGAVNSRLHLTHGLVAHVSTHPEIGETEFGKLASVLVAGHTGIRAIQLARNTVVSHIYPLEGNREARGLRLLEVPEQRAAVQRALHTRKTVVAGPVDLVQGGVAFVSRTPIYVNPPGGAPGTGPYWGLATILIDTETLLRESGVFDRSAGLRYGLRGKDGLGERGDVISGHPAIFAEQPVWLDVSVPNGTWQLAAIPAGGWASLSSAVWALRIGAILLATTAAAGALVWTRHRARSQERAEQLRLLLEVTQRLTTGLNLQAVLGAIAEAAAVVFKGEAAFRLVEGDDLVRVGATPAARERMVKERLRIGESLSGHVAATGRPLIVADSLADSRLISEHRAAVQPEGMATMCVPIRLGLSVLGTLAIYRERHHRFGQKDLTLALSLADQAASTIKNARLYGEAEEALRKQQQFLRQVIDVDANFIFVKDRAGRFTLVNQALAEVYGTTVDNVIGKTDADFNPHADEVAFFRRMDLEVIDTLKEQFIPEERITDIHGTLRWLQTVKRPIIGPDGTATQVVGSATDITERKRTEDALHASEQTLRELVDILPIAVYVCDADGVIERYNRRAVELWGREPRRDDPTARFGGAHKLYTPDGRYLPHSAGHVAEVLHTGLPVSNQEIVIERPDGSRRTAIINIIPRRDKQGKLTGVICCTNDITARNQAEVEIQQQRQLLTHLTRVATLGELSGALAHELNQPLTSILINAQAAQRLLASEPVDLTEMRETLDDIVDADRRAGEVIRRLRALLRKGETQPQSLDVNDLTKDVLRLVRPELLAQGVTASAQLTPERLLVLGDRVGLQQVLLNLILNACDAMRLAEPEQRRLTVTTAAAETDGVLIGVADSGPGIAADQIEQVFEPFFTTKEHGLGLGLVICRSIVAAHGGRLWASNNAERGATFYCVLPAA
jgi:PAS domain S-box-containing protein